MSDQKKSTRNNTRPGHRLDNLISTSLAMEYEDAKEAGMIGYMARSLVQATMPHTDPKAHYFERNTGLLTLSMMSKPSVGLPYGSVPRILLAWICTEAVRTKDPVLNLGRSQAEFLEKLQMHKDGRYTAALRNQAHRLFSSFISLSSETNSSIGLENIVIARKAFLFWNPKRPDDRSLWESTLTLSTDFFNDVTETPVPIRIDYLHALRKSPLAMDIYTMLVYRIFLLRAKNRPFVKIPWVSLMAQFGSNYGAQIDASLTDEQRIAKEKAAVASFKFNFKKRLREVGLLYPEGVKGIEDTGNCLLIKAAKLHIPRPPGKGVRISAIPSFESEGPTEPAKMELSPEGREAGLAAIASMKDQLRVKQK